MVSSEELRAALYRADHDGPLYDSDADTLAAAVRELYEALYGALSPESERQRAAVDVLDRYRAALEGGKDA